LSCCGSRFHLFLQLLLLIQSNEKAQKDLGTALAILDAQLKGKTYLVNDSITLADIVLVSTLLYPFKLVCDKSYLKPYGNVVAWFQNCVSQPEFARVVGKVELCKKALAAPGAAS
jgi:elongation factor 1-gamma